MQLIGLRTHDLRALRPDMMCHCFEVKNELSTVALQAIEQYRRLTPLPSVGSPKHTSRMARESHSHCRPTTLGRPIRACIQPAHHIVGRLQ